MRAWTTWRLALTLTLLTSATLGSQSPFSRFRVDASRYQTHLRTLASDELGGRANGTPGLKRAADYIAAEFKKARLAGGGDGNGYFQSVPIPALSEDGAGALLLQTPDGDEIFRIGAHYYPLTTPSAQSIPTASIPVSGVAFAGYGITAPGLGYDDYSGLDVTDKAVIVFTHEPRESDPESPFEGRALTPHSDLRQKAAVAASRGARVLFVVEDPTHVSDRALTREWTRDPQIDRFDIPVFRIDRMRLDRALAALDFESIARTLDRTFAAQSRVLPGITLTLVDPLTPLSSHASNVVGVLKGSDPALAAEGIVIGAHYDHLGRGGRHSEDRRGVGQVHNGADDNASGTAAVIEMAHTLARQRSRFRRSIIFVTFAAEEIGLLGSQHYVRRPPAGVRKTVAMLNLDMIGRARGRVMLRGAERVPFRAAIRELRPRVALRLVDFRDGYDDDASDQASFEREGVPTLAFFTGFHDDYHRPTDDVERVDAQGASHIAQLALGVAARLASR